MVNSGGWIVTNAHVVEGCLRVSVGGRGDGTGIVVDSQNDLAAMRTDSPASAVVAIRRSAPRLGEDIVALGYPLATVLSSSVKITTGNINSLLGLEDDTRYLQISTPIQPGSSGGPVVDQSGLLIGITTATLKSGATGDPSVAPQNVNFALRSKVLEGFLESRGISFVSTEEFGTQANTADIADKLAPAVVQIFCHGRDEMAAPASSVQPINPPYVSTRSFSSLDNHDVIGFDYATLQNVSQEQCQSACSNDSDCKAATYNKPNHYCFLKNDAKLIVRNNDAVASVVDALSSTVVMSTFAMASGKDMAGGDYKRMQGGFINCYITCELESECRAFAYVRKQRTCWLKSSVGPLSTKAGVDLGVK